MSGSPDTAIAKPLTFRRFKDGDHQPLAWQAEIFDADTPQVPDLASRAPRPARAACPSGEDIRGYLNIVRGIEKPPAGVPWQEYAWRRLTEANPLPRDGRVCPARASRAATATRSRITSASTRSSTSGRMGDRAQIVFPAAGLSRQEGRRDRWRPGGTVGRLQLARKGHSVTIFDERAELAG